MVDQAPGLTRVRSDYLGAGTFAVLPDDGALVVNTTYGVQAVGLDGKVSWQADLGERCLGVTLTDDDDVVANTVHAQHKLAPNGEILSVNKTRHEVGHPPIAWGRATLLVTLSRIYAMEPDGSVRWKFRFREALGESVRAVLVLSVLPIGDAVVVGVVDYNSGVGQVIIFEEDGRIRWQSELGPLASLFPIGDDRFLYTLSGYGRFESFCRDLRGEEAFRLPVGGPGVELEDGRLAMVVGTNESPAWDHWELRLFDPAGDELDSRPARGRVCSPPVQGPDGHLYFSSFFQPLDPAESRIDYTSYQPQPPFLAFDYLMRVKAASHQYNVSYFRAPIEGEIETIFSDVDSVAFGPPTAGDRHVFLVHNKDILVISCDE